MVEAQELVEEVYSETEMPCRATFLDDRLFAVRASKVTGMTAGGDLITKDQGDADRIPVLLFEPVHTIAMQDKVTGQWREGRLELLVAAGWHRVPPRLLMIGMPADGWGLYRTATGVELRHPYGGIVAKGRIALDPQSPRTRDIPVVVVNPSCEQLLLERDGTGGWRNATLDEFAALGLAPATENVPPCIPQMRAELRGEELSVTVAGGLAAGHEWVIVPSDHVRDRYATIAGSPSA